MAAGSSERFYRLLGTTRKIIMSIGVKLSFAAETYRRAAARLDRRRRTLIRKITHFRQTQSQCLADSYVETIIR
jgi:hypothetical protein